MENLGVYLAVFGFVVAIAVWLRTLQKARQAQATADTLQKELAASQAARDAARNEATLQSRKSDELNAMVLRLEKELAAAVARRDQKEIARAMWALELERSYRQWRDVIAPTSSRRTPMVNEGQQLSYAIAREVDRLREEVGVSIQFEGALDLPIDAEYALGALRITEELLSLSAKRADEIAVRLDEVTAPEPLSADDSTSAAPSNIAISLICSGWDAPVEDQETVELLAIARGMTHRLEGELEWSSTEKGRAARAIVPAPVPSPIDVSESEPVVDVNDGVAEGADDSHRVSH